MAKLLCHRPVQPAQAPASAQAARNARRDIRLTLRRRAPRLLELRRRRDQLPRHLHGRQRRELVARRSQPPGRQRNDQHHHKRRGQRQAVHRGSALPQLCRRQRMAQLVVHRTLRAAARAAQASRRSHGAERDGKRQERNPQLDQAQRRRHGLPVPVQGRASRARMGRLVHCAGRRR